MSEEINKQEKHNSNPHPNPKRGIVTVDGDEIEVELGKYIVSDFKDVVGVKADYDLDQLIHGKFETLPDASEVKIIGKEIFVSHVRTGGSSCD